MQIITTTYPIPSTPPPKMENERKKRRRAQHTKIDLVVKMINAHETKKEYARVKNTQDSSKGEPCVFYITCSHYFVLVT